MDVRTEIVRATLANGAIASVQATALGGEESVAFNLPSFDDVSNSIEAIAESLGTAIQRAKPKKATVEFGVEIAYESGQLTALMVKGTENANLKITLEWGEANT